VTASFAPSAASPWTPHSLPPEHCPPRLHCIRPLITRQGTEHGSNLGKHPYVVEQTFAPLHAFQRPRIRWKVRADIHEAFLSLACAPSCWRRLTSLGSSS
jgi:hypothetical protein